MFGSKKRESDKRNAGLEACGEQLYQVVRASIVEYANGSNLSKAAQSAIRSFLQTVDSDKSWLFDPSYSMIFTGKASPSMKSHFSTAESNITSTLRSIEKGAQNAALLQDLDTIRDTAVLMLTESFVEWFEFLEGDSDRAWGDYIISFACAENVLEAKYANSPDAGISYVISEHVNGICLFIAAMWSNSSQRAALEAFN